MNPVDPLPRQISQRSAIVRRRQHLGLEPSHLARGRGLGINGPSSDHLPHHRIERQTIRIIHIIVPGQPTKDRLAQQADQRVQTIVTSAGVSQNAARNVVQAEHLIQFPKQQQTTVRTDL